MTARTTPIVRAVAAAVLVMAVIAGGLAANNYLLQAGTTLAMSAALCLAWNVVGGFILLIVPGFIVQFGMHPDPEVNRSWDALTFPDDPVVQQNRRGTVTFAKPTAPNSRTTHLFINYADNFNLDEMGFSPIGTVVEGMSVVDSIYPEYGERPRQEIIAAQGNAYLEREFPNLDFIRSARVVPSATADSASRSQGARP